VLGLPYTLADLVDVQEIKQINAIITDAHISISVIFDIEYFILILFYLIKNVSIILSPEALTMS
tara:strand:- start:425 stop:616 length:192 start_codon:yes stop_codon:yes gene_type:complete